MPAKYFTYESPDPKKGKKKKFHARVVPNHTIKTDYLVDEIVDMSTFTHGDVKGTLEALSYLIEKHLGYGNSVELDGIGIFSVSVECPKDIDDPKEIKPSNVRFKKVNYKSSLRLKTGLKSMHFQRAAKKNNPEKPAKETRLQNILDYLEKHTIIHSTECMKINFCSRYQALKDLTELKSENKIIRQGKKGSCIYLLKNNH